MIFAARFSGLEISKTFDYLQKYGNFPVFPIPEGEGPMLKEKVASSLWTNFD